MELFDFGINRVVASALVFCRTAGIFTTAPIFGNKNVPMRVRVTIALALTFVFVPMTHFDATGLDTASFALAILKEVITGLFMGYMASLMFATIQTAGAYIDLTLGFGFAAMIDPMTKERDAVIGQFLNVLAVLLFLAINAHYLVIQGLADSYVVLPLGRMGYDPSIAGGVMHFFGIIVLAALKIAAPILGVVFLTDVALGILARTVPQLNVFVLGFPVKLAVGLTALFIILPVTAGVMTSLFAGIQTDLMDLMKHLAR
jgi:flagellar biosynthesis protein FliR